MIKIILYLVRAIGNGKKVLLYVFERKKKIKLCWVKYKTSLWWFCCSLHWTHDLTLIIKTSEMLSQGSPKPITDQVWKAYACKEKTKAHLQSHMSPKRRTLISFRRVSTALGEPLDSITFILIRP